MNEILNGLFYVWVLMSSVITLFVLAAVLGDWLE